MSRGGRVGGRRLRARLALGAVYAALGAGAVTTLYPFLVMVSGGFRGPTDQNDAGLIPAYWTDEAALRAKYVDDKYAGNLAWIASTRTGPAPEAETAAYRRFLLTLPASAFEAGFRTQPNGVTGRLDEAYHRWLERRFSSVTAINAAYLEEATSIEAVAPPYEMFDRPNWSPQPSRKWSDWLRFKAQLPAEFRLPITLRELFQAWMRTKYRFSWSSVPVARRGSARSFGELSPPSAGPLLAEFEATGVPSALRGGETVELRWLRFLGRAPARLPADSIAASAAVRLPIEADDAAFVHARRGSIAREFALRNFAYAWRYLAINGTALWNTLLYCGLAVAATLLVNGLAAYALSRYPIRASYKILIFLLATMAFPTEVTMIPNFLLLKNLHLLNTYWALVMPAAASGFIVFMLKGFFDSLPPELFEAAALDGARELTMLRRIAVPLSRPVFAYFGLLAFMAAYGNFLYAFLVAQDRRIWTVMVFVYELSNSAPKYVMLAAYTLVAVPTLVVFLAMQRVILRGIVLPGER